MKQVFPSFLLFNLVSVSHLKWPSKNFYFTLLLPQLRNQLPKEVVLSSREKPELPVCCPRLSGLRLPLQPSHQSSQKSLCSMLPGSTSCPCFPSSCAAGHTASRIHFQSLLPQLLTLLPSSTTQFLSPSLPIKHQTSNAVFYNKLTCAFPILFMSS